ncbi:hypothetical protein TWF173_010222 [Orbilia oligospora]|nr:hypothetical protein TWF173_010222 [Orbilia oligospora]
MAVHSPFGSTLKEDSQNYSQNGSESAGGTCGYSPYIVDLAGIRRLSLLSKERGKLVEWKGKKPNQVVFREKLKMVGFFLSANRFPRSGGLTLGGFLMAQNRNPHTYQRKRRER